MSQAGPAFLTINIVTAIVAFGPSLAFPLVYRIAAAEPAHRLLAHLVHAIQSRIVGPAALTMAMSAGLLVWADGIDLLAAHWLILATAFYVSAIGFSVLIQVPAVARMVDVLESMAPAPALSAGPGAALALTAAEVHSEPEEDPRLELARLGARAQAGGIVLTVMIVSIVALVVVEPGL
jgi:hypothetical protein